MSSVINLVLKSETSGCTVFQQLPDKSWEVTRSEVGKLLKRCIFNFIRGKTTSCTDSIDKLLEKAQINDSLQQSLCRFDLVSPRNLEADWRWAISISTTNQIEFAHSMLAQRHTLQFLVNFLFLLLLWGHLHLDTSTHVWVVK